MTENSDKCPHLSCLLTVSDLLQICQILKQILY